MNQKLLLTGYSVESCVCRIHLRLRLLIFHSVILPPQQRRGQPFVVWNAGSDFNDEIRRRADRVSDHNQVASSTETNNEARRLASNSHTNKYRDRQWIGSSRRRSDIAIRFRTDPIHGGYLHPAGAHWRCVGAANSRKGPTATVDSTSTRRKPANRDEAEKEAADEG